VAVGWLLRYFREVAFSWLSLPVPPVASHGLPVPSGVVIGGFYNNDSNTLTATFGDSGHRGASRGGFPYCLPGPVWDSPIANPSRVGLVSFIRGTNGTEEKEAVRA